MSIAAAVLVGLVAFEHLAFLVLEIFLWERPLGRKVFGQSKEAARATRVLAMNQGIYNGFLVAGLVWGLILGAQGTAVQIFFLACVVVAGVFGGFTASRQIFLVQALPAATALGLVLATSL
jgi:putative membrane protein